MYFIIFILINGRIDTIILKEILLNAMFKAKDWYSL